MTDGKYLNGIILFMNKPNICMNIFKNVPLEFLGTPSHPKCNDATLKSVKKKMSTNNF